MLIHRYTADVAASVETKSTNLFQGLELHEEFSLRWGIVVARQDSEPHLCSFLL